MTGSPRRSSPVWLLAAALACLACRDERRPRPVADPDLALTEWARTVGPLDVESLAAPDASLEVVTQLVFEDYPDLPHRLRTVWDGDARARVELGLLDTAADRIAYEYRIGKRVFARPAGEAASSELSGAERDGVLQRLAARRWLWTFDGDAGRELVPIDGTPASLVPDVGAGGTLVALDVRDDLGRTKARWSVVTTDDEGRPRRVRYASGGASQWTETLVSRSANVRLVERFFWPPDRWQGPVPRGTAEVLPTRSAERVVRRVALEPRPEGWKQALERGAAIAAQAPATLSGRALDPRRGFLVDARGRPIAVELVLSDGGPIPEGWRLEPASAGHVLLLEALEDLGPGSLGALAEAAGGLATGALVRPTGGPDDPASVFLPSSEASDR